MPVLVEKLLILVEVANVKEFTSKTGEKVRVYKHVFLNKENQLLTFWASDDTLKDEVKDVVGNFKESEAKAYFFSLSEFEGVTKEKLQTKAKAGGSGE